VKKCVYLILLFICVNAIDANAQVGLQFVSLDFETFADSESFVNIDTYTSNCSAGSLDTSLNGQVVTCTDQIQVATNGDEDLTLPCDNGYVYVYSVWGDPYATGEPASQLTDWEIYDPVTILEPLEVMYDPYFYYYWNTYLPNGIYFIQGGAVCYDDSGAIISGCLAEEAIQFEWIYDFSDPACEAILGCTNPCYTEYDADATTDDGTCTTEITGCADPNATNYDNTIPIACADETLCMYNDSDNDGITDNLEDTNGNGDYTDDDFDMDGIPNYIDTDDDNDGLLTEFEDVNSDGDLANDDTDGDGTPNYLDIDDDGDTVPTASEDLNGDGDFDNDDWDMDGIPNYLDVDDDGDGQSPEFEDLNVDGDLTNDDTDGDGTPNYLDDDDDGDGVDSSFEDVNGDGDLTNDDTDGDGIPNYIDDDDDGDGDLTIDEDTNGDGDPTNDDVDGDGIPGYLDFDERLVSIEAQKDDAIIVYPNPNQGEFIIQSNNQLSSLNIYNSAGQTIPYTIQKNQIKLLQNEKGIYLIETNNKRFKLIVN